MNKVNFVFANCSPEVTHAFAPFLKNDFPKLKLKIFEKLSDITISSIQSADYIIIDPVILGKIDKEMIIDLRWIKKKGVILAILTTAGNSGDTADKIFYDLGINKIARIPVSSYERFKALLF